MSASRDTINFFSTNELAELALEIISIAKFSPEDEVKYWTQDTFNEAYFQFSQNEHQVFNFLNKMPSSIAEKSKKLIEIIYESKQESVAIEVPRNLGFSRDRGKLDLAQFAILVNSLEGLKWLEEKNKNIAANLPDEILFIAAARRNVEMLEYLIKEKKLSINVLDEDDQCLLTFAIRAKHLPSIKFLMEQGIELPRDKITLQFMFNLVLDCEEPIIDYLLQSRFVKAYNALQVPIQQNSLLKYGVDHSNIDLIKECLVESRYKQQEMLYYASETLSLDLLKHLIEEYKPNLRKNNDIENILIQTIQIHTLWAKDKTIQKVKSIVSYLLTKDIDVNELDKFKRSALSYAVEFFDDVELLNILVAAGADIDVIDEEGESLVTRAAKKNSTKIFRRLIELKAPLNILTKTKETAITYSIKNDNAAIFQTLIANGEELYNKAYFSLPPEKRYSLLDLAFEKQSKVLFYMLLTTPEDITKNNYALFLKSLQKQYTRDLYYFNKLCQAGILEKIPTDIVEQVLNYSRSSLTTFKFVEKKLLEEKISIPYLEIYKDEINSGETTAIGAYCYSKIDTLIKAVNKEIISRFDECNDWLEKLEEAKLIEVTYDKKLIAVTYDKKDYSYYYFNCESLEKSNPGIFLENTLFRISKEICLISIRKKDKLKVTDEKLLIDSAILQYTKDQQEKIQKKFHGFESASSDFNRKSSQVIVAFKRYQELLAKAEKEVQSNLSIANVNIEQLSKIHKSFSDKIHASETTAKEIEKLFDESKQTLQQFIENRDAVINGCKPIISEHTLIKLFDNIDKNIQTVQQHYETAQRFLISFASETDACNIKINKISSCFGKPSKKASLTNNIQTFTIENESKALREIHEFQYDLDILQDEQQEIVNRLVVAPAEEKTKDSEQKEKDNAEEKTPNKITIVYPGYLKDGIPEYEEKVEAKEPSNDAMRTWKNEFVKLSRLNLTVAGEDLDNWITQFSKNLNAQQTAHVLQYQIASYILLFKLAAYCEELRLVECELFPFGKAAQIRNIIWHYKNLNLLNTPGFTEFKDILQMCELFSAYIKTAEKNKALDKPRAITNEFLATQIKSKLFAEFLKISSRNENCSKTEAKEVVDNLNTTLTTLNNSNLKSKKPAVDADKDPKVLALALAIRYLNSRISAISDDLNCRILDKTTNKKAVQDRHNNHSQTLQGNPSLLGNFAIRNINYSNASNYEDVEEKLSVNITNS